MLPVLLAPLSAAATPADGFECPELVTPADGYRHVVPGAISESVRDTLRTWIYHRFEPGCPNDCASSDSRYCNYASECVTSSGDHVVATHAYTYHALSWWESWEVEVETADGAWVTLSETGYEDHANYLHDLVTWDWSASWSGELDADLPVVATVTGHVEDEFSSSSAGVYFGLSEAWSAGECAWQATAGDYEGDRAWIVEQGAHTLSVSDRALWCGHIAYAELDAVEYVIRDDTWGTSADSDADGCLAEEDCDDVDAARGTCTSEEACTGVDEDCDGADLTDADGDGFDGIECPGGDDCDDADSGINPGVLDDDDGHVDLDCDGRYHGVPPDPDEDPSPAGETGCGGGGGAALLLLATRRRRASPP